jgi:hypothetical protein
MGLGREISRIRRQPALSFGVCVLLGGALLGAFAPHSPARAGSTSPELALGQVSAIPVAGGAILELTGTWDFDDILQIDFPASLLVSRDSSFIRIPIAGAGEAAAGSLAELADGLQTSEIPALESAGQPESGAVLLRLEPHRMQVALPASVGNGPLTALVYVEFPGEGFFLSNPLTTMLEGVEGAAP